MTTHQPKTQPDYLDELNAVSADMNRVHARLNSLMAVFATDHGELPDEWADCYRAFQALHLATQLLHVARDNEQARRAPVPFLPVEPAAQAHMRAILDDVLGDKA